MLQSRRPVRPRGRLRRHTSQSRFQSSPQSLPSFQSINSDDLTDTSFLQLPMNIRFAFQRAE